MARMTREQARWLAAELALRAAADLAADPQALRLRVNDWLLDADEFDKRDAVKDLTKELDLFVRAIRARTNRLLASEQMQEVEG